MPWQGHTFEVSAQDCFGSSRAERPTSVSASFCTFNSWPRMFGTVSCSSIAGSTTCPFKQLRWPHPAPFVRKSRAPQFVHGSRCPSRKRGTTILHTHMWRAYAHAAHKFARKFIKFSIFFEKWEYSAHLILYNGSMVQVLSTTLNFQRVLVITTYRSLFCVFCTRY